MTPEQFVFWLKGWLEVQNPKRVLEPQVKLILEKVDQTILNMNPIPIGQEHIHTMPVIKVQ